MKRKEFVKPELGPNCDECPIRDRCIGAQAILSVRQAIDYHSSTDSYDPYLSNLLVDVGASTKTGLDSKKGTLLSTTVGAVQQCRSACRRVV